LGKISFNNKKHDLKLKTERNSQFILDKGIKDEKDLKHIRNNFFTFVEGHQDSYLFL